MNKKINICILSVLLLGATGAFADSLAVNGTAAIEGSFGLEVDVSGAGGLPLAFVQDDTPAGETVYRGSFLINPNNVGIDPIPSRLSIFEAFTNTTANNTCQPTCPAFWPAVSIYLENIFPPVGQYQIRAWVWGNQGGPAAAARLALPNKTGDYRVCFELETGNPGALRAEVVTGTGPCPGTYTTTAATINSQAAVEFIRMGGTGNDNFPPDNSGSIYFDSFESFRTLAP